MEASELLANNLGEVSEGDITLYSETQLLSDSTPMLLSSISLDGWEFYV